MEWIVLVQQPGYCNVVRYQGGQDHKPTGEIRRIYQEHRTRCEGFLLGYTMADKYQVLEAPPVICAPGDCLKMEWIEREPPTTWGKDCKEWK